MKTQTISILAVCTLGACDGSSPGDGPVLPTRDLGDVMPRELYLRDTPPVTKGLAQTTIPVSPERVVTPKPGTERLVFHGALVRFSADPSRTVIEVPVDTAGKGAWLYVQPAATGDALDAALADIQVESPTGEQLQTGDGAIQLGDRPAGVYRILVGARARPYGMAIELAQPDSPITLALETTDAVHVPGSATRVEVALFDGTTPIRNARVTATLVSPDGTRSTPLAVQTSGAGTSNVLVAPAFRLDSPTGMYSVFVAAEATTTSGVRLTKSGTVAVKYTIPTARISGVMPMRAVRGAGHIDAFEIDVRLEVASTDRYELTGLVAATHRGVARRVCVAQTADILEPGERLLTLRCDAGLVKLTRLQGTFHLEQLQLFSQGRAELLHRITRGLASIRVTDVQHAQLADLREPSPAVDEMITQGLYALD